MQIRIYTKLSDMSSEEIAEHKRKQRLEIKRRYRLRKLHEAKGLPVVPRLYVNKGKTEQEIKERKAELNKRNRGKTNEN